jgi:hypothetical protein
MLFSSVVFGQTKTIRILDGQQPIYGAVISDSASNLVIAISEGNGFAKIPDTVQSVVVKALGYYVKYSSVKNCKETCIIQLK